MGLDAYSIQGEIGLSVALEVEGRWHLESDVLHSLMKGLELELVFRVEG